VVAVEVRVTYVTADGDTVCLPGTTTFQFRRHAIVDAGLFID
jgi:hypothetical protein